LLSLVLAIAIGEQETENGQGGGCACVQVKDKKAVLDSLYDNLISRELQRRLKDVEGTNSKEMERYRSEMEEEREKASRRTKKISKEQELLVSGN
jgi:hypothetical protein